MKIDDYFEYQQTCDTKVNRYGEVTSYSSIVKHHGLNLSKTISGKSLDEVKEKIHFTYRNWNERWIKIVNKKDSEALHQTREEEANDKTEKSQAHLQSLKSILSATLDVNDAINWDDLLDKSEFTEFKPDRPELYRSPFEPKKEHYHTKPTFFQKILGKSKKIALDDEINYESALERYHKQSAEVKIENDIAIEKWELAKVHWQERKEIHAQVQREYNQQISTLKAKYEAGEQQAILDYYKLVFSNSTYPEPISLQHRIEYATENKSLAIEIELPSISSLPDGLSFKYIRSKEYIEEKKISPKELDKLYDDLIYQIIIRVAHESFEADIANHVNHLFINGNVNFIDPSTGKLTSACVATISIEKMSFLDMNLSAVDPKLCFRKLKGISAVSFKNVTPIAPIFNMNTHDRRFIEGYEVLRNVGTTTNLASMNWEDFEHLVRELFEREFSSTGGEVRVTQSSSDGGVDAVAFDPDPIRGGKIVIQAKRYTNIVGVSAVRDLWGTVQHEGATKGILVTTSDYGPDSYEFVKGKPLTLLNGSNLLNLLEKHGTKASINITEAKNTMR